MKIKRYFIGNRNESQDKSEIQPLTLINVIAEKRSTLESFSEFIDKIFAKTPWKDANKTFYSPKELPNNISSEPTSLRVFILFGLQPKDIGLQCAHLPYETLYVNNTVIICAASIEKVHESIEDKKKLWQALQSLMSRVNTKP